VGIAAEWVLYGWGDPRDWVPDLVTGWSLIGCGLVAWSRRPESRSGMLMAASGFAWFAANFATTGVGTIAWLSAHALYLYRGPLLQLVLTFPRGRSGGRVERTAVAAGYIASLVTPIWRSEQATIVLASLLVGLATYGYLRAVGRERRERLSALQATALLASVLAVTSAVRLAVSTQRAEEATLLVYQASLCTLAFLMLAGLLRAPWARAAVTDLVVALGETQTGTLRDALARALGDPSLQVGYWLPERGGFVDSAGEPLHVPDRGSERSSTFVERDGQPVAVLVHDPAVLDDPGLLEAVSSAAKLASVNARLQAEVQARLAEIRASRRRILQAGDEERGRLERRLHEGAERRLDELAQTLRRARGSAARADTIERITKSEGQLARTQEELLRLARGIHPRELSEQGLAAALASLAKDFPLPVQLALSRIDASQSMEACAYFVCAEALANVAKYASAANVRISVGSRPAALVVEVSDDGVGGADPDRGTGLRGLADRVETLGGSLRVVSPPGGGTHVTAVIPQGREPT
jgi:signal transduction histidine kinase